MWSKDEFPYVIHDKMGDVKISFPRLQVTNKVICGLGQLPIMLTSIIAHGHDDERTQYSNELWPNDPNFTIGSLLWLLSILEKVPAYESKMLFEYCPQNALFACLLQGKSCCITKLKTLSESVGPKLLPICFCFKWIIM
jgi:hypothetical protein